MSTDSTNSKTKKHISRWLRSPTISISNSNNCTESRPSRINREIGSHTTSPVVYRSATSSIASVNALTDSTVCSPMWPMRNESSLRSP